MTAQTVDAKMPPFFIVPFPLEDCTKDMKIIYGPFETIQEASQCKLPFFQGQYDVLDRNGNFCHSLSQPAVAK